MDSTFSRLNYKKRCQNQVSLHSKNVDYTEKFKNTPSLMINHIFDNTEGSSYHSE